MFDRLSLLTIVASLELALRHPGLPPATREANLRIGKVLVTRLLQDGLLVPPEAREVWEKTFKMSVSGGE